MTEEAMTVNQVETKMWAMANELRGNMSPSEFQTYILSFMFYQYLSSHQESYLIDQDLLDIQDGEDPNAAFLRVPVDEIEDYLQDIAAVLGYAIRPEFTWKTLINKIENHALRASDFQDVFNDFEKNAEINPEATADFRGIFNDMNLTNSRLGTTTDARAKALAGIMQMVQEVGLNDAGGRDVLGSVYEYLIGQFAADSGKKAGEFYTPHQVSQVLARIVTLGAKTDRPFRVYDPTMGSGSLLLTVQNELNGGSVHFSGQELNTTTYNLSRMNLMMHGVDYQNMQLHNADTLESDWPSQETNGVSRPEMFDAVVANPPYSANWDNDDRKLKDPRFEPYGKLAPKTKADYALVLHALYHLDKDGTAAIVLPHGVLFRGAAEGAIRKAIIDKNQLDAVIGLPANLFYSTSIPTIVLVLKKNRTRKDILFIDASQGFEKVKKQNFLRNEDIDKIVETYKAREDVDKYAHVADLDEIKANDYNLNIPRYVDTFEEEAPIDIAAVKQEIKDVDAEIAKLEAEFAAMEAELVMTDGE